MGQHHLCSALTSNPQGNVVQATASEDAAANPTSVDARSSTHLLPPAPSGRSMSIRPVQGSTMCWMYTITGLPSTTPGGQNAFLILLFTYGGALPDSRALDDCKQNIPDNGKSLLVTSQ